MPALVPHRFLVRLAHPCLYHKAMLLAKGDVLLDLPESARLSNFAELDGKTSFADLRLAWNEFGLGIQLTIPGKKLSSQGDAERPRSADGLSLWLDTRDARTSHRASRYCHQFHFLPTGSGPEKDEPTAGQTKVNRALQDAPFADASAVLLRHHKLKAGYRLEAFLPAVALTGFDPEQHPRWGVYYHIRDEELGDQYLAVNSEFPFADDPSLWDVLELVRG